MLVDALHLVGLDALAQVDVGVRKHRHQDGQALGGISAAIYRTAQLRLARGHRSRPGPHPVQTAGTVSSRARTRWTRRNVLRWSNLPYQKRRAA